MCERTTENRGAVHDGILALAAQYKWACISFIGMQIGYQKTVFDGARRKRKLKGSNN